MALIETSELERWIKHACTGCDNYNGVRCRACWVDDVLNIIDMQIPVDAIPVKWLKENFPTNGVYGTESYFRKAHAVEDILKDWELEKEKRKDE